MSKIGQPLGFLGGGGGVLAGAVLGAAVIGLRSRITDPVLETVIALVTPYAAYVLGELLQPAGDATDQIALGERGLHGEDREPHLGVVQDTVRLGTGDHLQQPGGRVDEHEHRPVGCHQGRVQALGERPGLALRPTDEDGELEAARRLGVADRLVDLLALRRAERVTSGHWCLLGPVRAGRP